jgi:soluble lytic murein transglycosylase
MTFAGYNAGRGRVRDWIKLRGDPRDPNVDAVDWVERIPFSETRNYVQRVIENLGVYRARFGTGTSAPAMARREPAPAVAAKPEPAPAPGSATAAAQAPGPGQTNAAAPAKAAASASAAAGTQ